MMKTEALKSLADLGRLRSVPTGTAAVLKDVFARCVAEAPDRVAARRMFVTAAVHNPDLRAQLLTDDEAASLANRRATAEFDELDRLAKARDGAISSTPAKTGQSRRAPSQQFDAGAAIAAPAKTGQTRGAPRVEPKPSEGAAIAAPAKTGQTRGAPSPRPQSVSDIRAAGAVARHIARTVLDSFRVRDGRPIGDLRWDELERLRADNAMEASVLRQLLRHGNPASPGSLVRDTVSPETLERMIQRGAEVADAA
jgi:hypothetical protein